MKILICALFVATFTFSSCAVLDRTPSIYYNEDKLSLEQITEMERDFENPESETERAVLVPVGDVIPDIPVFWTKNGKVWHLTTECGHLSSESEIFYGSTHSAEQNGKTRVCVTCDKRD